MKYKSILIGSEGYLGRHLAFHLENAGFENLNCDLVPKASEDATNYRQIDITRKDDLENLDMDCDFVFLFAGFTGTSNGFEDYHRFIEVNEIGLLNLLTRMRETNSRARLIYPSTRLVYRGIKNCLLGEDAPKEAKTIYAANKLNAENVLWMYHNAFDINYTIFRICVPYGNLFGNDFSYGTLGFFIKNARRGKDISLYGNGSIKRTFTHVMDICTLIADAIKSDETVNQVYNIGGEVMSLGDVASWVAKKFKVSAKFTDWPDLAHRLESDDTVFDDTKLRQLGGVTYKHRIADWIDSL